MSSMCSQEQNSDPPWERKVPAADGFDGMEQGGKLAEVLGRMAAISVARSVLKSVPVTCASHRGFCLEDAGSGEGL